MTAVLLVGEDLREKGREQERGEDTVEGSFLEPLKE